MGGDPTVVIGGGTGGNGTAYGNSASNITSGAGGAGGAGGSASANGGNATSGPATVNNTSFLAQSIKQSIRAKART
jgi:hypothetical protein